MWNKWNEMKWMEREIEIEIDSDEKKKMDEKEWKKKIMRIDL